MRQQVSSNYALQQPTKLCSTHCEAHSTSTVHATVCRPAPRESPQRCKCLTWAESQPLRDLPSGAASTISPCAAAAHKAVHDVACSRCEPHVDRGNRLTDASASPGSRELPALLHLPLGILRGFDVLQLEAEEAREGDEGGRQRREAREGDTEQRNRQRT